MECDPISKEICRLSKLNLDKNNQKIYNIIILQNKGRDF
jgi:hypothetical protein